MSGNKGNHNEKVIATCAIIIVVIEIARFILEFLR